MSVKYKYVLLSKNCVTSYECYTDFKIIITMLLKMITWKLKTDNTFQLINILNWELQLKHSVKLPYQTSFFYPTKKHGQSLFFYLL